MDTDAHDRLLDKPNVIAVGETPDGTLTAVVSQKRPPEELDESDLVAHAAPDRETDVLDAGMGERRDAFDPLLLTDTGTLQAHSDRHSQHRPVESGVSECHSESTAATAGHWPARVADTSAGLWADDVDEGDIVRLSNAHVYALSGDASLGDPILQPSPFDGGGTSDQSGTLAGYAPLETGVTADVAARTSGVDETRTPHHLSEEWPTGVIREDYQRLVGDTLTKSGRTTGVTEASLRATGASVRVNYPHGTVTLRDQLLTDDLSDGGDSGSPVYTTDGKLAGLVFAGSQTITAVCSAANVEAELGVELMSNNPQNHESEQSYEDWKHEQLRERYGESNVSRQVSLDTGRRVDLLVTDADRGVRLAFELENDSGSVISGAGQAAHYSRQVFRENPDGGVVYPVLAVPEGHIDADERQDLESAGIRVVEDAVPETVSLSGV